MGHLIDSVTISSSWLTINVALFNHDFSVAKKQQEKVIDIQLQVEPELAAEEFVDVLRRSTLAERRPVDQSDVIAGMLKHADVIATARTADGLLVGVARSISDFHFCTYLSDLAVDSEFQRQGIGKKLIDYSHEKCGSKTTLILLAAPAAQEYYPRIGMKAHHSCWIRKSESWQVTLPGEQDGS